MTDHRANKFTLVFAKKGAGKSHLSRFLAAEYPRRILLDPMYESTNGVIVKSAPAAVQYLRQFAYGGDKAGAPFSLILRTLQPEEELQLVALTMYGDPERPLLPGTLLYIEELDRLCKPSSIPPAMHRLANYGRHFGVSMIGTARSPKGIHRDFTRGADEIHIGRLQEPLDVDYLSEYTGSEFCERAKTLEEWQFICWPRDMAGQRSEKSSGKTQPEDTTENDNDDTTELDAELDRAGSPPPDSEDVA